MVVVHGKRSISVDLAEGETVGGLKARLHALTRVLPKRQKLLGLPPAPDEAVLATLAYKPKLMLMGRAEEEYEAQAKEEAEGLQAQAAVHDDLDLPPSLALPTHECEANLAKIRSRAAKYSPERLAPPREGKKLLVLDVRRLPSPPLSSASASFPPPPLPSP